MGRATFIPAFSPEAILKRRVRSHLKRLGFSRDRDGKLLAPVDSKESIRALHQNPAAREGLAEQRPFLKDYLPELLLLPPAARTLTLRKLSRAWNSSTPALGNPTFFGPLRCPGPCRCPKGLGRRLRYLVWDDLKSEIDGAAGIGRPRLQFAGARSQLLVGTYAIWRSAL